MKVKIEQSVIDDMMVLHGINVMEEIKQIMIKESGVEPEIKITNEGDVSES